MTFTHLYYVLLFIPFVFCTKGHYSNSQENTNQNTNNGSGNNTNSVGCPNAVYKDWQNSQYVLPYRVGETFQVGLSHCSGSYHSQGEPDQFAVDFNMPIGTIITASRAGIVVFVEESGEDYNFPNNLVVVKHNDDTYAEYMHLTKDGAIVEVGMQVIQGSYIGYSGATGLAGYPHLHFIIAKDSWGYPYQSIPYNFKNTTANPRCLESGKNYTAEPY